MKDLVEKYFSDRNASINTHPAIKEECTYEFLSYYIEEGTLEIPGFILMGYSNTLIGDVCFHNFYYEEENSEEDLNIDITKKSDFEFKCKDLPILQEEYSQPKPMYSYTGYSLYITIVGEP